MVTCLLIPFVGNVCTYVPPMDHQMYLTINSTYNNPKP